jgi:hypothetical protein
MMQVNYGTANGSPIIAEESAGNYDSRTQVTLTTTYVRSLPDGAEFGYVDPDFTGNGNSPTGTGAPHTFSSGTTLTLFPAEAGGADLRRRGDGRLEEELMPAMFSAGVDINGAPVVFPGETPPFLTKQITFTAFYLRTMPGNQFVTVSGGPVSPQREIFNGGNGNGYTAGSMAELGVNEAAALVARRLAEYT